MWNYALLLSAPLSLVGRRFTLYNQHYHKQAAFVARTIQPYLPTPYHICPPNGTQSPKAVAPATSRSPAFKRPRASGKTWNQTRSKDCTNGQAIMSTSL